MKFSRGIGIETIEHVFYGNYFYGVCAVALILETQFLLHLPLSDPLVYLLAFLVTVLYYRYPFVRIITHIRYEQKILSTGFLITLLFYLYRYWDELLQVPYTIYGTLFIFALVAASYYGIPSRRRSFNLRKFGTLKPFVIGFTWTGLIFVFPVVHAHWMEGHVMDANFYTLLQFCKSIMYISMLAILFDIKDYVSDKRQGLHTWVVLFGLRKTLFKILIPLTILGILMFLSYALPHGFSFPRMFITMIPFILLIFTAFSFGKKRSSLFYMIVIDGLMLIKAITGIAASSFV